MSSSIDEVTRQGGILPSRSGLAPIPSSEPRITLAGVSSSYAPNASIEPVWHRDDASWHVLRIRYNHDAEASLQLRQAGLHVYFPSHPVVQLVRGERAVVDVPLLHGLLFAHDTRRALETFMQSGSSMATHVRFYRDKTAACASDDGLHPPLVVDDRAMQSFMRVCDARSLYSRLLTSDELRQIAAGDVMRVIGGPFKDVVGRVARVNRQRCVVVDLRGVCAIATAFIPKNLLQILPPE